MKRLSKRARLILKLSLAAVIALALLTPFLLASRQSSRDAYELYLHFDAMIPDFSNEPLVSMFWHENKLYYTDGKRSLYRMSELNMAGDLAGERLGDIEAAGGVVWQIVDALYFSDGGAVYMRPYPEAESVTLASANDPPAEIMARGGRCGLCSLSCLSEGLPVVLYIIARKEAGEFSYDRYFYRYDPSAGQMTPVDGLALEPWFQKDGRDVTDYPGVLCESRTIGSDGSQPYLRRGVQNSALLMILPPDGNPYELCAIDADFTLSRNPIGSLVMASNLRERLAVYEKSCRRVTFYHIPID